MRRILAKFVVRIAAVLACASSVNGAVRYVDTSNTTGTAQDRDGTTWAKAFKYLQDALDAAQAGDTIKVAQGTYHPDDEEIGSQHTQGSTSEAFLLKDDVVIEGGYRGIAGLPNNADDRSFTAYETILSGDLSDNDPTTTDNSADVVRGNGANEFARLSGVTIIAAKEHGVENSSDTEAAFDDIIIRDIVSSTNGAGMHNSAASPTLTRVTFASNTA